jgi:hypothetical protein
MKFKSLLAFVLALVVALAACKKNDTTPTPLGANLPAGIKTYVTQETLDSLKSLGVVINEGTNPPTLDGIFDYKPAKCIRDNSNANKLGLFFNAQRFKFSNFNPVSKEMIVLTKDVVFNEVLTSTEAYISGSDNKFSVFINSTGLQYGIQSKVVFVISGEISGTNLINVTNTYFLTEKGPDPTGKLINPKTGRVFQDNDFISERVSTF